MNCEIYVYDGRYSNSKKYKLDIPKDIQINITYSFSSLTNPTIIADNYSKTITIPGTANNNKILGYCYKFDREIVSRNDIIGFNYNPSKRISYDLVINDVLYQKGWMKLNKIKQQKSEIAYDITLYGELSNCLYKLSNTDKDDKDNKLLYSLTFPNNLTHVINKETLKSFIDNSNPLSGYFTYIRANNGLYDEFESSKFLTRDSSGYVVTDILDGLDFDELQKREVRSYYQRPALSVYGILDRIKADEDEFTINYDDSFFNDSNPYYSKSVMTLPLLTSYSNETMVEGNIATATIAQNTMTTLGISSNYTGLISSNKIDFSKLEGNKILSVEFEVGFDVVLPNEAISRYGYHGSFDNTYHPNLKVYYKSNNTLYDMTPFNEVCATLNPNTTGNLTNNYALYIPGDASKGYSYWNWNTPYKIFKTSQKLPVKFSIDLLEHNLSESTGEIVVKIDFPNTVWTEPHNGTGGHYTSATFSNVTIYPITQPDETSNNLNNFYPASAGFTGVPLNITILQTLRSGYEVTKDLLLDKETSQADFLIDYCKLFGLIMDTDKDGNLNILTKNSYFSDYEILDWSDKLDYNQPIETNPLSFDTKYLTFNYKNAGSKYEDLYSNKYGIDYGQLKVNTGYEFNNDSKTMYESIFENTVMSKEIDRLLIDGATVVNKSSNLILPAYFSTGESNREAVNTRFNLLFDNGTKTLTGNDQYWITDDSSKMRDESIGGGEYCWLNCSDASISSLGITIPMNYYRQHTTLYNEGNTICSFDVFRPRENYAGFNAVSYPESATIYNRFWQNYIKEIYNVNSKEISAYFKLSYNDMNNFSFKNFVMINGVLFHPIKIENYNPLANNTTKVTLIKVNDILNYTSGQSVPVISVNYFNVTNSFALNCTLDYPSQVAEGGTFVCNITKRDPLGSIYIDGCELSMGGVTLNPGDYIDTTNNTLTIPNVTGNIVFGISCTEIIAGGDSGGDGPVIGPVIPDDGDEEEVTKTFASSKMSLPNATNYSTLPRLYQIGAVSKLSELNKGITSIHEVETVTVNSSGTTLTIGPLFWEFVYGIAESPYIFVNYSDTTSGSKATWYAPVLDRKMLYSENTFTMMPYLDV